MTRDDIIRMARESGFEVDEEGEILESDKWHTQTIFVERFAALIAAAVEERLKWDGLHSCHSECDRPACVHTRKTYQEGYEAGRKDENEAAIEDARTVGGEAGAEMEKLIRARRQK